MKRDIEDAYLTAFSLLSKEAQDMYLRYGDLMDAVPVDLPALAEKKAIALASLEEANAFVCVWGSPTSGGLPLAPSSGDIPPAHFVIPDAHFSRKDRSNNFQRAKRLGSYLGIVHAKCRRKGQALRVICLGDWWDMVSLCHFEKGKKDFGQMGVKEDMDAGAVAISVLHRAFEDTCAKYKVPHDEGVSFHFTNGNHEYRLNQALDDTQSAALLKGMPTHKDILEDLGWRFYPYMVAANIDGVAYAHCMPSGAMGRPVSGANLAKTLLDKMMVSCVVGHTHSYDMSLRHDAFGNRMFALVAGCYYDTVPKYAKSTAHLWWRGVSILNGVQDGYLVRGYAAVTVDDMADTVGF